MSTFAFLTYEKVRKSNILGGGQADEESSRTLLHDVALDQSPVHPELVVVRVRLFAILRLPLV